MVEKFVLNESLSKNEDVSNPSKVTDRKKITFEEKINETLDGKMVIIDLMDEDQNRKPIQQCSKFTFPCSTTPSTLKKYSHTVEQLDQHSTPIKMKTNVLWEFEKTLQKDIILYKKSRHKIVSNSSFGLSVVKSKMQGLPGTKTKRPMQMDQMQQILEKVPMNKTTDAITKKIYGEIFRIGQHIEYCVVKKSKQAETTKTYLNLIPYPLQVPEPNTPPPSEHDLFLIEWQPKITLLCQKYCPRALPKIPKLLKKYDNKAMILGYLNQKFFPKFQVSQDDQTTVCFLENGTIENENKNNIQFPLVPSWQLFQDTNHSFWKKQTFAYLDFTKNNESMGRVLIHLRLDICPITCQNFKGLCTHTNKDNQPGAPGYKNSEIHRIVLGFMIQGGDYELNNGTGGKSIWGSTFDDENFTLKHTRGAVSMANNGTNMNRSQWFICQSEKRCQNLDGKHVVFGYVVDGMNIVTSINQGATESQNGSKPKDCIMISDCGVLNWPSDEKNRSEVPSAKKKLLIW